MNIQSRIQYLIAWSRNIFQIISFMMFWFVHCLAHLSFSFRLFGFEFDAVDYGADVDVDVKIGSIE